MQALLAEKAASENGRIVTLGCPLNNLIQEMSPVDADFRQRLNALFQDWVTTVAQGITRGQASGEVSNSVDAEQTAFFIVSALEGCIGMSKNTQSIEAFRGCLMQLGRFLETLKARS